MSKRGAAGSGSGPETGSAHFQTLLDFSNGPVLPPVAVGTSHNYGATGPTALPRETELNPIQNVMGVVQRIDTGLDDSEQRTSFSRNNSINSSRNGSRTSSAVQSRNSSIGGRRRTKREPTPDDQLFHTLREATESPTRDMHSDRTPSPPIPQEVSTDSSPDMSPPRRKDSVFSVIANSPMYPKPLRQLSSLFSRDGPNNNNNTPRRDSSVDNASEISFELERTVHDDELQRTRPSDRGSNLSKAPRRPSGVQIQPTIEEEEEELSSVQADEPDYVNVADRTWTAEAKTVIPSRFESEPPSETSEPALDRAVPEEIHPISTSNSSENRRRASPRRPYETTTESANWMKGIIVLLCSLLIFAVWGPDLCDRLSPDNNPIIIPNGTNHRQVNDLRSRMSDMNKQISSLSKEVRSARSEQRKAGSQPTNLPYNHPYHSVDLQINFLSPSSGAFVDPDSSSPSANSRNIKEVSDSDNSWFTLPRIRNPVSPFTWSTSHLKKPHPHNAALLPWEEPGDCWCTTRDAQLAVYLGRAIVPEEVVIEHVPMTATLDPTSAPKDIELWARFGVMDSDESDEENLSSEFPWKSPWGSGQHLRQSQDPKPAKKQGIGKFTAHGAGSLHELIMNSLKVSNPHDDPNNYSDDAQLGPNFYRIGRFFYDIKNGNYRQSFPVTPLIDVPGVRTDKVVFRVKDNWGSPQTCLYRFKLYGHT